MTDNLPPECDQHVVELSLGHVLITLGIIIAIGAGSAALITILKDHQKQKRQMAILDGIREIITIIQSKGIPSCKEKKTASSSPTKS